MNIQDILELRPLITIAHHVPGRIRLRLDPRILQHPAASALASLSEGQTDTGLLSARLNLLARSLVLEYDTTRISPDELIAFIDGSDPDNDVPLARKMASLLGIQLTG